MVAPPVTGDGCVEDCNCHGESRCKPCSRFEMGKQVHECMRTGYRQWAYCSQEKVSKYVRWAVDDHVIVIIAIDNYVHVCTAVAIIKWTLASTEPSGCSWSVLRWNAQNSTMQLCTISGNDVTTGISVLSSGALETKQNRKNYGLQNTSTNQSMIIVCVPSF